MSPQSSASDERTKRAIAAIDAIEVAPSELTSLQPNRDADRIADHSPAAPLKTIIRDTEAVQELIKFRQLIRTEAGEGKSKAQRVWSIFIVLLVGSIAVFVFIQTQDTFLDRSTEFQAALALWSAALIVALFHEILWFFSSIYRNRRRPGDAGSAARRPFRLSSGAKRIIEEKRRAATDTDTGSLPRTTSLLEKYLTWPQVRHEAENLRRAIHEAIFDASMPKGTGSTPDEIDLLLLKLEYFRRFQLESQITYYVNSIDKLSKGTWRLDRFRKIALGFLSITAILLLSIFIVAKVEQGCLMWMASIATFLQPLDTVYVDVFATFFMLAFFAIFLVFRLQLIRDDRALYQTALAKLLRLQSERLPEVRVKAARGDRDAVRQFIDQVHEVMRDENYAWVSF